MPPARPGALARHLRRGRGAGRPPGGQPAARGCAHRGVPARRGRLRPRHGRRRRACKDGGASGRAHRGRRHPGRRGGRWWPWAGRRRRSGGVPPGILPAVRPVKGHILRLRTGSTDRLLERTVRGLVHGRACYLVPRRTARSSSGPRSRRWAPDRRVQAGAVHALLDDARSLVPGIDELELERVLGRPAPGHAGQRAPLVGWTDGARGSPWRPATTATASCSPRSPPAALGALLTGPAAPRRGGAPSIAAGRSAPLGPPDGGGSAGRCDVLVNGDELVLAAGTTVAELVEAVCPVTAAWPSPSTARWCHARRGAGWSWWTVRSWRS